MKAMTALSPTITSRVSSQMTKHSIHNEGAYEMRNLIVGKAITWEWRLRVSKGGPTGRSPCSAGSPVLFPDRRCERFLRKEGCDRIALPARSEGGDHERAVDVAAYNDFRRSGPRQALKPRGTR
jgi:hypothetical protein